MKATRRLIHHGRFASESHLLVMYTKMKNDRNSSKHSKRISFLVLLES